ncbi:MAG: SDR family NAD(P)-dependent oxidoreductase, partial [Deltaproteobacteria bacterium]|nr:SDR family NAD(P)-dependent oxidoreductase [Deltaproteobacteria bacterium]
MSDPATSNSSIAVVGVSALFPGSSDERGFWSDILSGRDLIAEVPASHWLVDDYYDPDPAAPDKTYCRRGAFLDPVSFDPMAWGVPPNLISATDTSQLLALIVAQRVLEDASRGQFAGMNKDRVSVILGVTSAQEMLAPMVSRLQRPVWVKALREAGLPESRVQEACERIAAHYVPWQEATFPGLLGNVVAGRIANRLDLGGTNCVTDAACASAFAALSMAINELRLGQSDLVISGGVDTLNDIFMFMCFSKTLAMSTSGDCRPFSDQADGTILGEGLAMVALKRLADAERDGDSIYAVLRGLGASSDGRAKSVYAPVAEGQARALRRAYQQAGYAPRTVELVEAHGTATKAGDVAEFEGLKLAFDDGGDGRQWCALGSVKSQIGHTKAAAGAAGLFKAAMALHHGVLPPTIKVDRPNPALGLPDSPFYLNLHSRPWVRGGDHPRRAAVSSFGFGGSNYHLTLEEYRGRAPRAGRLRAVDGELVLLSAETPAALIEAVRSVEVGGRGTLEWLARDSQERFVVGRPARLAIVASDEQDLAAKLERAAGLIAGAQDAAASQPGVHYACAARPGGVALLFPGQGSQYLEMGGAVAMTWRGALEVWDRAAEIDMGGRRLDQVVFPPPVFSDEERQAQRALLTQTQWAQPAIGAMSLSLLHLLNEVGVKADCVGGHSFGELTALHAAGVFDEATLLRLARQRGELMHLAAATPGAMTAVAAGIDQVRAVLVETGVEVSVANHNAPRQVVLAGPMAAIEAAERAFGQRQMASQRLPVATAFHSEIVGDALAPFRRALEEVELAPAALPVFANATAAPYPAPFAAVRSLLATQIVSPVRFVEEIEAMYAAGARTFVEVGPGSVLTGLVKQILDGRAHQAIALDHRGRSGVVSFFEAIGRLAVAGVALELAPLWREYRRAVDPRSVKAPSLALQICGSNYGKPYPPPGGAAKLPLPNPEPPLAAKADGEAARAVETPAPAVATAAALPAPAEQAAWIAAYQELQRQTAEAQTAWQTTMAQTHLAFLQATETSLAALGALLTGQPLTAPDATASAEVASLPASIPLAPAAASTTAAPNDREPRSTTTGSVQPNAPAAVAEVAPPTAVPAGLAAADPDAGPDLKALLLSVIAEKTGYPTEILTMEMGLEADLGIDSIKRVEILSALRQRSPHLPEVNAAEMGKLKTLGQIVQRLQSTLGTDSPAAAPEPTASAEPAPVHSAPAGSTPASIATAAGASVAQRLELTQVDAPAAGLAVAGLYAGPVAVTDDGRGIGAALVRQLRARGVDAVQRIEVAADAAAVLILDGLCPIADDAAADDVNRRAFGSARAVAARFAERGGLLITVQDTGGDFGLGGSERAWVGGLAALAKTAHQEWPAASVRAIDLECGERGPDELAAALVEELFGGGLELEVGLHADGRRTTLRAMARDAARGKLPLDERSLLVVSGGARGVTAAALIELARAARPRLALLGRTPIDDEPALFAEIRDEAGLKQAAVQLASQQGRRVAPAQLGEQIRQILAGREIRATLAALQRAGSEARYLRVDVIDAAEVRRALELVRQQMGAITGLVHGAGVLADRLIADKSDAQFDQVFSTKVQGLRALLAATSGDPLRLICLFSSLAARAGNAGQCDYAMANEVLNKVAALEARRRGPGCLVRALDWGPWQGGMVTPELRAQFEARATPLLSLERGSQLFVEELRTGSGPPSEVVLVAAAAGASPPGNARRSARFEVQVDATTLPQLADHCVLGVPVVPVVLVLEWFAAAAAALRPELALVACRELKVLK